MCLPYTPYFYHLQTLAKRAQAASSKMKEIIRPVWMRDRGFWQVDLMFKPPGSSPDAPATGQEVLTVCPALRGKPGNSCP